MKLFDLERAKAGDPVCTRDGNKARIICFDRVGGGWPLVALVTKHNQEILVTVTDKGESIAGIKNDNDLFMAQKKQERWLLIYRYKHSTEDGECFFVCDSEEEMISQINSIDITVIHTQKIEWKES